MIDGLAGYWSSRFVFERALALIYLIAFVCTANQFIPLVGERGLLSASRFIQAVPFRAAPSLFYLWSSDAAFRICAWLGIGLCIYFFYGRHHSILGKELRGEIATHGVSPAGMISDKLKGY